MSIRLRLTLLYTAILALTLIAFSVILYLTLAQTTLGVVKDTLADEAKRLLSERSVDFVRRGLVITVPSSNRAIQNTFVQTRRLDGNIEFRSPNSVEADIELPLQAQVRTRVLEAGYAYDFATIRNTRFLVYSKPITYSERVVGVLQVARSLEDQDRALDVVRRTLLAGSSIAAILAFGIGWVLAGTALRPINRITQTAHAIGAERDFGRRVSHAGPQDEVGRLATTINTMLAALQGAYRQEAQALQAQRRFVADASHELRTPLTTIRGNIALLQRDPPISSTDRTAVLADMVDESERMSRLVHDLLSLARADAGRQLRRETVPIKPLIEDVCRKAKTLGPDRTIICAEVHNVAILGDPDALKQVLLILLDNALKFTPAPGEITLSTTVRNGRVRISVRDTGIGIASDTLQHIFERFYRGDSSRTGGGAGLGLAIAKALVDALDGTVSVASQLGVGSEFMIELPQAPLVGADTAEADAIAVNM